MLQPNPQIAKQMLHRWVLEVDAGICTTYWLVVQLMWVISDRGIGLSVHSLKRECDILTSRSRWDSTCPMAWVYALIFLSAFLEEMHLLSSSNEDLTSSILELLESQFATFNILKQAHH